MKRYNHELSAIDILDLVGEAPIMLEIGCHEGADTIRFLEYMPGIRLFCFDPEQRATKRFKQAVLPDERVTLYEEAVADVDGPRDFHASTGKAGRRDDWDFSGSLREPTGHLARSPEITFKEPVSVPCMRLDTWFADHPEIDNIDFIWADIQGSQRLFIAGAQHILSKTRYLYIESHDPPLYAGEPTQDELIDELYSMFSPVAIYRENILFESMTAASVC